MSDSRIVFVGRLTTAAPGQIVYHAQSRDWRRTDCGRAIVHRQDCPDEPRFIADMNTCRRDIADLIGRPCRSCRWRDW